MIVTTEETKKYLRVDSDAEDELITSLLEAAQTLCMNVMRTEDENTFSQAKNSKAAVLYATAYFYEHREEADHHGLTLSLRALLFGERKMMF